MTCIYISSIAKSIILIISYQRIIYFIKIERNYIHSHPILINYYSIFIILKCRYKAGQ